MFLQQSIVMVKIAQSPSTSGKVYQMCNEVGGGGGSLRYTLVTNNTNIVHCHTTIYPCILHEVKMTFKGYKSLPKNLKGIKIDVLILNLMT